MVYARQIEGVTLTFGVSGMLIMGALVMYDRESDSLWSQFLGEAVQGPLDTVVLEMLPSQLTTMGAWISEHPDTLVLNPGVPGGTLDPYSYYYDTPASSVQGETNRDGRLYDKDLVVGITTETGQKAYSFAVLREGGVVNDTFESRDLVVFMKTGRAASIQSAAGDSKGGATSVFDRKVGGLTLTFQGFDSQLAVDRETRSTWNKSTGVAIQGELKGERLNRVTSMVAFWLAWFDFYPDTEVYVP